MRLQIALALGTAAVLAGGVTYAQSAPDRDAIAGQIHEMIAQAFRDATQKLKIGPVLVGEAVNGIHPVSVAGVSARLSDDPEDEGATQLTMEQFALTAEPLSPERLRLTHVSMPDGVTLLSAAGQRIGSLGAASGRAAGIFDAALGRLTMLDLAIDQPRLAVDRQAEGGDLLLVRADRLAVDGADTQDADGLWSSSGVFSLTGLALRDQTEAGFDLASLSVEGDLDGVPDEAMRLLADIDMAPDGLGAEALAPELLGAGLLDGLAFSLDLRGLSLQGIPDVPDIALERLRTGIDVSGLRSEAGRIGLTMELAGLQTGLEGPEGEHWGSAIPDRLDLDLSLEGLPATPLWQALAQDLEGTGDLDANALPLMYAAPLALALNRLALHLDGTEIEATGALRAEPQAALGAVGHLDVAALGLINLKNRIETLSPPEERGEAVAMFDYLYGSAQPAPDGSGRSVLRFELLATGEILLNGAPFDPPAAGKRK
jgi:hypothetical protein